MQQNAAGLADFHKARFEALWDRTAGGASATAGSIYGCLTQLYGEPHRHYHTLDHIWRCLAEFDGAAALAEEPDSVELALWFHDAVYTPCAVDNEWRSAELFRHCAEGHTEPTLQQRVCDLIMATTHRQAPERRDECLIVDIDLAGFGLAWEAFERDSQHLRVEFQQVADQKYYPDLLAFFLALQQRPVFFRTKFFQGRYESNARANLARAIAGLHARGYR